MQSAYVIIPTYNEQENLRCLIDQILAQHPALRVLIVDDNSPDGTGKLADELSKSDERITVLHRPAKMGLGSAYRDGFRRAISLGADLLIEMDADFSHDPAVLPIFIEKAKSMI